jgi:hypothetical protein
MISEKELGTLELYLKQAFNEGTKSYVRDAGLQLHYQKSKLRHPRTIIRMAMG